MGAHLRDSSDRIITRWVRGEPGELAPENRELLDEIEDQIRDEERDRVVGEVGHWDPLDIAELLLHLPIKFARRLFSWLPSSVAVDVLVEVSTDLRSQLMQDLSLIHISEPTRPMKESRLPGCGW